MRVLVWRAVERGNLIDAGEARDRGADIAAVEQVGAAHRLSLGMQTDEFGCLPLKDGAGSGGKR